MRNINRMKRLAAVERQLGSRRIPTEIVRQHFDRFRDTGELPDDQALAIAVHQRVERGFDLFYLSDGTPDWPRTWPGLARAAMYSPRRERDAVMDELLAEAIYGTGFTRAAGRGALIMLSHLGMDVTTTPFAGREVELPKYGSVGAALLGYPGRLVQPPYEEQGGRLLARLDDLQQRVPQGNRGWFEDLGHALVHFQRTGQLPSGELEISAVLVLAEVTALLDHKCGRDVANAMAAFDAVATATSDERPARIKHLQAVQAGRAE